jgi:hypothetical protein
VLAIQGIAILPVHQVAFEGLDDGVHLPLRPVFIVHEIFDAVPLGRAVIITTPPLVEELTMLLADVFAVSPAIFDFHFFAPSISGKDARTREYRPDYSTPHFTEQSFRVVLGS